MGIKKLARNTGVVAQLLCTGPASISGALNVGSQAAIARLSGDDSWRGFSSILSGDTISTVSASAIGSGVAVVLTAQSSAAPLMVSSIVDGVSFAAETPDGAFATGPFNYSYVIIE